MKRKWMGWTFIAVLGVGVVASGTWFCLNTMVHRTLTSCGAAKKVDWPQLLNLTKDQEGQVQPSIQKFEKENGRTQTELAKKHISLCQLIMGPARPDLEKVKKLINEISQLRREKDQKMADHLLALRAQLKPDQQRILLRTLMQDICSECQTMTGTKLDCWGPCKI